MAMAFFLHGKPIMQSYTPSAAYSAGDVIVVGNLPCVAHEDNPPFTGAAQSAGGTATIKDALAIGNGIYQMAADAAYANGTFVWWNPTAKQVTAAPVAGNLPFGFIIAGPNDGLDDGGPTGAAGTCSVFHDPSYSFAGKAPLALAPLAGAADAISPHVSSTYVVTKAGVDAMTLAAPTVTTDDGVLITVTSNTANAHTITATGLFQNGTTGGPHNLATFAAFPGASIQLMAYQGKWNVLSSNVVTIS